MTNQQQSGLTMSFITVYNTTQHKYNNVHVLNVSSCCAIATNWLICWKRYDKLRRRIALTTSQCLRYIPV